MAAMKEMKNHLDVNRNPTYAIPAKTYVDAAVLAASTKEDMTVPSGARIVVFSSTGDFFANYDADAAVPSDTTDGTASELNPTTRNIQGVTTISLIASATPTVTLTYYK